MQVRLDDGTSVLSRMSGVLHPRPGDTVHLRVTGLVRAYRPAGRRDPHLHTGPSRQRSRRSSTTPASATRPPSLAGDRDAQPRRRSTASSPTAPATWGPERRLVLVEGANDLDSLVAYLAALQHGHVALVVPDGRAAQRDAIVAAYDPDIVCAAGEPRRRTPSATAHDLHPDLALLLSTSGTTGSPKLVRLSRDNVASNAAAIADYLGADARPTARSPRCRCTTATASRCCTRTSSPARASC